MRVENANDNIYTKHMNMNVNIFVVEKREQNLHNCK